MPLVLADRVRDTTTTTGTGTVTLSGTAPTGYQNFSVIGNGNTTYYTINAGSQWEVGIGTYSSTGPTLSRDTVLESSNANALVDFAAGVKDVFVTYPSDKVIIQDASGNVGVGTASPAFKLDVAGSVRTSIGNSFYSYTEDYGVGTPDSSGLQIFTGAGDTIRFGRRSLGTFTERMRLDNVGNLGIGTTSPIARLDVVGAADTYARINDGTVNLVLQSYTTGSSAIVGTTSNHALTLWSNAAERMRITAAGNVGIGTNSPATLLDVNGVTTFRGSTNQTSGAHFTSNGEGLWMNGFASYGAGITSDAAGTAIRLWTSGSERARITSGGNLLVGTTVNYSRLTVSNGNSTRSGITISDANTASLMMFAGASSNAVIAIDTNNLVFKTGATAGQDNGTERLTINSSGNVIANVDFRAPIYYDSNNTAFYLDPGAGGTSANFAASIVIGGQYARSLAHEGYLNGQYGSVSNNSTVNPIYCISGGFAPSSATNLGNMYGIGFVDGGQSGVWAGGGWGMYAADGGTARVFLDAGTGIVYSTGSVRAPAFFDSNNTAFYLDPAGTSVLTTVYARKTAGNNSPAIEVRGGNFGFPRIQTYGLDADPAAWMGLGTDMGGGPYEHSVYFPTASGAGRLSIGDYNGTTYNPRVWVYPTFTQINNSTRSPIFYDSDNTGFYLDPASTSNINAANGMWMVGTTNAADTINGSTWYGVGRNNIGSGQVQLAGFYGILLRTSGAIMNVEGDYAQINGSFRAPIYYDSNNTAFYLDPASTSITNIVRANTIQFSNGNVANDLANATYNILCDPSARIALYLGNGDPNNYYDNNGHIFRNRATVTVAQINGSGVFAPVYYDSNDSAYYLDPNTTSNDALRIRGGATFGPNSTWGAFLRVGSNGWVGDYASVAATNGNLHIDAQPGYDLYLNWYVARPVWSEGGAYFPIYYDRSNSAFYVDPASGSRLGGQVLFNGGTNIASNGDVYARRDGGSGGVYYFADGGSKFLYWDGSQYNFGGAFSTVGHIFQAGQDMRAPIYYDSNNTGYYLDPATTGLALRTAGYWQQDSTAWAGDINGKIQYHGNNWYFNSANEWIFRASSGAQPFYVTQSGAAVAAQDMRAPIFYDLNNTGFYVDPTGTSVMADAVIGGRTMSTAMFYAGFTLDANTMQSNATGFTYSVNAPFTGPIARFSTGGGYDLWLNAPYWGGGGLVFRTRNGDLGTFNAWQSVVVYGQNGGGEVWGTRFNDSNNSAYYVDPNSTSRMNVILADGVQSFGNVTANGDLVVGNGQNASYIYMIDVDEGQRIIHCNSNRIGFLTQAGGWGAFCNDDGSWQSDNAVLAPIYYDSNNTGYYLDLTGYSQVNGNGSVNGSNTTGLNIFSTGGNGAIMAFHRGGFFAVNMGLDSDNVFRIGGWSAGANRLQMDMSGNLTMAGNVTAFSDVRLKKDIETIDGALDLVSRMRGVRFTRIENDERNVGVVAQEMLEVLPEVVQQGVGDDDTLSVAYGNLVGVLIEAIKELRAEVAELKGK